jgi:hypothetical protein
MNERMKIRDPEIEELRVYSFSCYFVFTCIDIDIDIFTINFAERGVYNRSGYAR